MERPQDNLLAQSTSHNPNAGVTVSLGTPHRRRQNDPDDNDDDAERVPVWRLWKRHALSLSRAGTTPCWMTWLVPLLSLWTHWIFYYGQTRPMWHLHLSQQVDLWANATTMESRGVLHTLGLPPHNELSSHDERQVKTFSYWYAIQELWKAKHMPGKVLPRSAAVLLIIFSGIWPHLKLLLLNTTWLFAIHQRRRTRMLTWLSTLGKWSLADVLVVCVMVGVLHLDWMVDPDAIRAGVLDHLPFLLRVVKSLYSASDICTMLLKHVDCHEHHHSWKRWSECKACVGLVKTALDHPEQARASFHTALHGIAVSGGGHVTLRVLGLKGIYAFGPAVIMSIFISLLVDVLDGQAHRAHAARQHHQRQRSGRLYLLPGTTNDNEEDHDDDDDSNVGDLYGVQDPSLVGDDDDDELEHGTAYPSGTDEDQAYHDLIQSTTTSPTTVQEIVCNVVQRYALLLLCLGTCAMVGTGILIPTIQRNVHGAIPDLLRDVLGVVWNRDYSLWTLVQTTGAAGGMDWLLLGTFGLFVIVGPTTRALLCVVAWWTRPWLQGRTRRQVLASIELVGAFCAWEVFAVAVGMVDMLMPAITGTVVIKPELCSSVSEDGTCLQVNFDLQDAFWVAVVGGGLLLIALSNLAFGHSGRRPRTTNHNNIQHESLRSWRSERQPHELSLTSNLLSSPP